MLYWTIKFPENLFDINIINLLANTLYLVILSSFVLIIFALISNYGNRVSKNKILNFLSTFSISGYAIPGVILAVAFITYIAWFDENIIKSLGFLPFILIIESPGSKPISSAMELFSILSISAGLIW